MTAFARARLRVAAALFVMAMLAWGFARAFELAPCGDVARVLAVSLLARTSVPVCFTDREPGIVVEERRAHLPPDADLLASAARLAHLARHLDDGSTSGPVRGEPCAHWLEARGRREAVARELERHMLARFGVDALPLPGLPSHCER